MEKRGMSRKTISIVVVVSLIVVVVLGIIIYLVSQEAETSKPDPVSERCQFACESGQEIAFCDVKRTVDDLKLTCDELATNSEYSRYGVEPCAEISCEVYEQEKQEEQENIDQTCITGLGGEWLEPTTEGTCPQTGSKIVRKITPSDEPPTAGQICCK